MARITLIGTEHSDPELRRRLRTTLDRLNPDILAVEFTQYQIDQPRDDFYGEMARIFREAGYPAPYIDAVIEGAKSTDYTEFFVSQEYARTHDLQDPYLIEDPTDIQERVKSQNLSMLAMMRGIQPYDARSMGSMPPPQTTSFDTLMRYHLIQQSFQVATPNPDLEHYIGQLNSQGRRIGPRDDYMADQIRGIAREHPGSHIAVPIGFIHLVNDREARTLYEKVKDLRPTRVIVDF